MALLLKGARLIDPAVGLDEKADMIVRDGKIVEIGQDLSIPKGVERDLSGKIITPGLCDIHVHLRDPGLEYKEDIESGTRAAAKGGFTSVCCMPNTSPTIDSAATVDYVINKANDVGSCRVHVVGACSKGLGGETLAEIGDMVAHGAVAFTDDGRGVQDSGMMRRVMEYVGMFDKVVMSHCQDEGLVSDGQINEGEVSTKLGLAGWPDAGEELQIARDIALCRLTGTALHIQHITTKRGLDLVRQAKLEGLPVTCEVTPHHLFLDETAITDDYNANFKVNPPLRTKADREALIEGVRDGAIDCIVTDHAPHAEWEKNCEFELAAFGMTGLETSLGLVLTFLVHEGVIDMQRMIELMAINPRKIVHLDQVTLEPESLADLTIIDPEEEWIVTEEEMCSKAKNSGFLGIQLRGRPVETFIGGYEPSLSC